MIEEYCIEIKYTKLLCNEPDCKSIAQGSTDKCKRHGGGKRCNEPDCKVGAKGATDKCIAHGGGKRCNEPDCKSSAIGATNKCKKHGVEIIKFFQ